MALTHLHNQGVIKHIVSQNCDGLHLRSGLPSISLSELHGNMFVEVCSSPTCRTLYHRDFDVSEKTARFKHKTGRSCSKCHSDLIDTIVHFGEKGILEWPLNWQAAIDHVKKCDLIVCLGSSLKVLRQYACLWPKRSSKVKLAIVNLQWTPKDSQAVLKINGRCDEVMKVVMHQLELDFDFEYKRSSDPLKSLFTKLTPEQQLGCNRIHLFSECASLQSCDDTNDDKGETESAESRPQSSHGWFGKGLRVKKR